MSGDTQTISVDPERLAPGRWDHALQSQQGEGDIAASYSGDRIGLGRPVRRPFRWDGGLWVCTGFRGLTSGLIAEAYELTPQTGFVGTVLDYAEKTQDAAAARDDPRGFYHGMIVWSRGEPMVLTGPPHRFVAGEVQQPDLFAGIETHRRDIGR